MNEQHVSRSPSIAIIGAGPRGTSILERLGAHLFAGQTPDYARHDRPTLEVHIIDDAPAGPGRIWRTDQPRDLCMNTLAHAVTLFTEPGATIAGPVREGPTLYEWGVLIRSGSGMAGFGPAPGAPEMCGEESALGHPKNGFFPAHFGILEKHPVRAGLAADYRDELAQLRPESHPSRALYGEYLAWCFDRAIALLPEWVRVTRHRVRAVGIDRITSLAHGLGDGLGTDRTDGQGDGLGADRTHGLGAVDAVQSLTRERLTLDDGSVVAADAVILATGWLPVAETRAERDLAAQVAAARQGAHRGPSGGVSAAAAAPTWVRPASPIEQDLSAIAAGDSVIMRGLGMSFFDTLSLLTLGRGGRFERDSAAPGGLRYIASGAEPIVHATSRRGVPFRSKSLYGGLPPRPTQRFLRAVDWAHEPRPINFDRKLWPRIVADAFLDHAQTLERVRPGSVVVPSANAVVSPISAPDVAGPLGALEVVIARVITALEVEAIEAETIEAETQGAKAVAVAARAGLLHAIARVSSAVEPFIADPALRFDLAGEIDPAQGQFASPAVFDAWVRERVITDLREAERGTESAVKAGLWSISAARAIASRIGTLGGFDAESRASGFRLLFDLGGMVGSGPPAFRNRQLLALSAAGLVRFIGPEGAVSAAGTFTAESPRVAGSRVTATALVDAWMHFHSLDATADPLASALLRSGRARSFCATSRKAAPCGGVAAVPTGGFDVDPDSGLLIRADGTVDPAVHVAGIPADQTLHDTVISPMPGTDPPMLRETDRVARSAIRIALSSHPTPMLPLGAQREGVLRA